MQGGSFQGGYSMNVEKDTHPGKEYIEEVVLGAIQGEDVVYLSTPRSTGEISPWVYGRYSENTGGVI
ncbi:hypothetical protein NMY22_g8011 [Coprinellus aureogranulatus]|nr:hypothetical protein NMY22_g8011 [Coprinellus aureogranulatus]